MNKFIILIVLFNYSSFAYCQKSCSQYPFDKGVRTFTVNSVTKIVSTGQAKVLIDDIDSIKNAREEATIEAKAQILKAKTINTPSQPLLKGVANLGSCYTKSSHSRVTVSLSATTIKNSQHINDSINNNLVNKNNHKKNNLNFESEKDNLINQKNNQINSTPLRGLNEYSNSQKINSF